MRFLGAKYASNAFAAGARSTQDLAMGTYSTPQTP